MSAAPPNADPASPSADDSRSAGESPEPTCFTGEELERFHEWATGVIELQIERRLPVSSVGFLWRAWRFPPPMPPVEVKPLNVEPLPEGKTWGDILDEIGFTERIREREAEAAAEAEGRDREREAARCPRCGCRGPAVDQTAANRAADEGYDPMPGFGRPVRGDA